MHETACPLCGADRPHPAYHITRDCQHGTRGPFHGVRCTECGVLYLNPRPSAAELARYYPTEYAPYQRGPLESGPWWARWMRLYGLDKRCRAVTRSMALRSSSATSETPSQASSASQPSP